MRILLSIIILALLSLTSNIEAQELLPYKDPTLPTEERINDLLGRMTLEEKLAQIRHLHSWHIFDGQTLNYEKLEEKCGDVGFGFFEGFPLTAASCRQNFREIQSYMLNKTRLGIPAFSVAESLHGVVHEGATIYPQIIALGSTFNPDLAYQKTKMISGELNTMGVRQVLGPCIDVVRDLRWGRVEEAFSEDPFLSSRMAVAEVKGYLDHGISPMAKHYGPHGNPLGGLNLASVECGPRDLFDIYLKPFESVVKETNIMAIMSSYNAWNRTPNSASYFMLTEVLRNQFGFKGYVYSDWGVIRMLKSFHKTAEDAFDAASQALTSGLDVEASSDYFPSLTEKIESGEFDVKYVNEAVKRVLRAKFELGLFEDPYQDNAKHRLPLRSEESIKLSRLIADESTVLLKNDGGLLPLDVNKLKSIAVIGPNADEVQFGDYTWSKNKEDGVTPLQGLQNLLGNKVKINYARGCGLASLDKSGIKEAVRAAKKSDVALIFVGSSSTAFVRHSDKPSTSGEGIDLHDISLTGVQEELIKSVHAVGKPVVVILVAGKPFAIPWVKDHIPAIVAQWYAGEQEGNSIADILFGNVNPSGKLSFSFPQSTGHLPVYYNHLSTDKGYYKRPGTYEQPGRDYVFSNPSPLWAFGHGLSYTTFEYLIAVTDKKIYGPNDMISINVSLRNTGDVIGKEVVQVYVRDVVSSVMTPVQQLKGFSKLEIKPNQTVETTITIPAYELFLTDNNGERYLEPGEFEIQVGSASDNIHFKLPIRLEPNISIAFLNETQIESPTITTEPKSEGEIIDIIGNVRDIQATPIMGVLVRSDIAETMTDNNGNFVIKAKSNSKLIFSKKGMSENVVDINGQKQINIQMTIGD